MKLIACDFGQEFQVTKGRNVEWGPVALGIEDHPTDAEVL